MDIQLKNLPSIEYKTRHALSKICSSTTVHPSINRLPPEVLALIPYSLDSYRDVVRATHVCRHWRNTFIYSPPLWSNLNSTMPEELVAAFVVRCCAVPLDVTLCSELQFRNFPFLKILAPRSAHIRKMCFPGLGLRHIGELSDVFDEPLQMLREVDINDSDGFKMVPLRPRWPLLARATNLVSLNLLNNNWEPGTLLYFAPPTLTHLKIQFLKLRTPSTHELLDLFRNLPRLEDIHVVAENVQDAAEEGSAFSDQFEPIDLPRLHNIYLSWKTSQTQCTLLTHIKYPPTCSVSLQVRATGDVAEPPQNPFPESWEAFSLPNLSSVTLRITHKYKTTECAVIVKELGGPSISVSHYEDLDPFILDNDDEIVVYGNRERDNDHVFLAAIVLARKLPLHWVKEFVLEDLRGDPCTYFKLPLEIPPGLIKSIHLDLPHPTTLLLTKTCVSELFTTLTPPPPMNVVDLFKEVGASKSNLPCPTLKVLEI